MPWLAELGGAPLADIARGLAQASDPDAQDAARERGGPAAARELVREATRPLANPELRKRILTIRRSYDLPYDEHTADVLLGVEARDMSVDAAQSTVTSWRQYLADNRDEIDALRVAFGDLRRDPAAVYAQLADLARQIQRPPHRWTPAVLWDAYRKLGIARGNGGRKGVPELVSILRFELGLEAELVAYRSQVEANLANWLARQEQAGMRFTVDQRWFVDRIASAVASRLYITEDTLDDMPFTENGGIDGFVAAFGDDRAAELLDELNRELPA
jgi:type I restriction enzyme R subunit